jgi:hypothetical protein
MLSHASLRSCAHATGTQGRRMPANAAGKVGACLRHSRHKVGGCLQMSHASLRSWVGGCLGRWVPAVLVGKGG